MSALPSSNSLRALARQCRALFTLCLWCTVAIGSASVSAAPDANPWALWDRSDENNSAAIDHSAWQTILDDYVVTLADDRTTFRYQAVTEAHKTLLAGYLQQLAGIDPRDFNRATQMAYWINLYNALTIQVVLDHPSKNSILRMGGGWLPRGPWDDDVIAVAGQKLTLNDIEHRILRPLWQDHRIHFAVNCASIGCPNLADQAFSAAQLEQQLQAAERAFLGHPRGLTMVDGELQLSSIFDWYMEDFGKSREELLQYLASASGQPALTDYDGDIDFQYDWDLNGAP